jgi:hypothetical protein
VLNNLHISVLSSSKRGVGYCSLADVEAGTSLWNSLLHPSSDISGVVVVTDVANNMNINVLTQKRGDCDVVKVTAIVKNLLENLNVNVLTQSKRSTYSVSAIATSKIHFTFATAWFWLFFVEAKDILEGNVSKRGDALANVVVDVVNDLDHLTATVAKRDDVDVVAGTYFSRCSVKTS